LSRLTKHESTLTRNAADSFDSNGR
jgi:hypothetical protein